MFLSKMIKKENAETSASETFGMYHGLLKQCSDFCTLQK